MKMSASTEVAQDSPAQGLSEEFLRAAEDFAVMQQEHQAALRAGECENLFSWGHSRERAFQSLVRTLDRGAACGQDNQDCVVRAREIMGRLLAEEEVLQKLILAWQLKMQGQLLAMRKGKEALQGYNINKGLVPRPRYLSNKT